MNVQVNIALHANYILSTPDKRWDEMGISSVEVDANKLNIDDDAETAAPGSWLGSPVIMQNDAGIFRATLELEQDSIYKIRVTVNTGSGSKTHKNFYVDTADSTSLYALDVAVTFITRPGDRPFPLAGANLLLVPGGSVEFPKFLDGILKGGNPITLDGQTGATDAEKLYQYVKVKETGVNFTATSNPRGMLTLQQLPAGAYGVDITASGHDTFTTNETITGNRSLTYQLTKS